MAAIHGGGRINIWSMVGEANRKRLLSDRQDKPHHNRLSNSP